MTLLNKVGPPRIHLHVGVGVCTYYSLITFTFKSIN